MSDERGREASVPRSAWAVVCARELRDLWIGGKALHLILLYTVLLGIYSFLLASNAEVNLLPLKEMILEMVKAAIAVCLLITMIIAADSITSERERATLESLLLTPASRRQIVLGKYLAAVSPMPVALVITVPYLVVLSKGDPVLGPALLWLFVFGGVVVPALAGIGMLASIWCRTTKASMLVTLGLYLLMLLPSEIIRPGKVMTAAELRKSLMIQSMSPIDAMSKFLGRVLAFEMPASEQLVLLAGPAVIAATVLVLVFMGASPRIRLEPATWRRLRALWRRVYGPPRNRAAARATDATTSQAAEASQPIQVVRVPRSRTLVVQAEARPSGTPVAAWWLVFRRELRDLWVGGKALNLTVAYTLILGGYSYWLAHDSAISVIPPKEMVFELMKVVFIVAVFMSLIIGADSLSGERERATLEGLLVTPTRRLHIVIGKFFAAVSAWPVAFLVTVPYVYVLAQGDEVLWQALMWGAILGTLLAPAFTALGMFVSFWCNSNKSSLFVTLGLYLIFLLPTQLPGNAQGGFMGLLFQALNPMAGTRHFLAGILVNNRTPVEYSEFIVSAVVFFVVILALLFWYAGPELRLEAGRPRRWARGRSAVAGAVLGLLALGGSASAWALQTPEPQAAPRAVVDAPLQIAIDKADTVVRAGMPILFNTVVKNDAAEASRPIIVAMNIINLDRSGEVVDPEDWSPQRTQYVESLAPGESVTLSWRVNAILDGDFMVYMVAIPNPGSPDATSQPVASSGIHLTVTPYTKLNPGGVLPYALGGPALLGLIIFFVYRHRRRQIDMGGASGAE